MASIQHAKRVSVYSVTTHPAQSEASPPTSIWGLSIDDHDDDDDENDDDDDGDGNDAEYDA